MYADTYNTLIQAFGYQFENFSTKEMSLFCQCLAQAGLRQGDIFKEVMNRLQSPPKEGTRQQHIHFGRTYLPLLKSAIQLNFTNEPWF